MSHLDALLYFMEDGLITKKQALDILSNDSWYYPWGEPKQDAPETVRPPSCQHEYVDVGFMHPKVVCKHCNVEKSDEEA